MSFAFTKFYKVQLIINKIVLQFDHQTSLVFSGKEILQV